MRNDKKTTFKAIFRKITPSFLRPKLIFRRIGQIFLYLYRIVLYRTFSINVNTKEYWNKRLSKIEGAWRDDHYHLIVGMLPENENFTLLDVGCALGDGIILLKDKYPKAKFSGLDISEIGIEKAKQKAPDVSYHVIDILKDEIPKMYDYILIVQTLEHFDDPHFIVDTLLKHCKKSIIVSVPYTKGVDGRFNFVDEHRYSFNEKTFEKYNSKVIQITDFMEKTGDPCIIYEIFSKK